MVDVSKYLERADNEAKRKNFDGAMTLYEEILRIDPDSGEARRGIRRAALKKHEKSYPSAFLRAILNLGPSMSGFFAGLFRSHAGVASACEKALKNDPRNVKLNLKLGHALLRLGHRRSAEAAFQVVTEFDPEDVESLKTLGRLYYDNKRLDESLACYERVLKINPRDQDAAKMRKNLAAEGAIQTGGFQSAKSARDVAKSQAQLDEIEKRQKIVASEEYVASALKELEERVAKNESDGVALLELGRLKARSGDFDGAVDALVRASKSPNAPAETADVLGDARLKRLEKRYAEANASKEDGAADRARRLKADLVRLQIEEFQRRVAAHPTDAALRYRLAEALLEDGEIDAAVEQLQQTVKDPRQRIGSLTLLGRAFAEKGLPDLAVKQYQEAADAVPSMNDRKKDLLYRLAETEERRGRKDQALDVYKRIFEADIGFRDVGRRIDALRNG
ncbi:MAG TPA: tetratricopeptide repeat protein [Planctomycetota bacterium]|nr:tetratricopeptide repeat protein [Planctomycetota bacterium]